jgi:hypothetical protein
MPTPAPAHPNPTLPRIFFSLSSADEPFVRKVANNPIHGLAFLYTENHSTGDEVIATLQRHVRSSWIFAFFASEDSLESHWVNFELVS